MNEIKWQRYLESLQDNVNPLKFAKYVRILLQEDNFDKNCDDILQKIDNLLLEMNESEQKEAQDIISTILKD